MPDAGFAITHSPHYTHITLNALHWGNLAPEAKVAQHCAGM